MTPPWARSLRLRMALSGAVAVVAALALAAAGLALLFDRHVNRLALVDLDARALSLAAGVEVVGDRADLVQAPADPLYAQPLSGHYWELAIDGQVLRSRSLWDGALQPDGGGTAAPPRARRGARP